MTEKPGLYKVHVSNLDPRVTESDINDLFSEFKGMGFYTVHYTKDGVAQGSAEVHYEDYHSVQEVVKQYNGVPLDGWPLCLCFVRNPGGKLISLYNWNDDKNKISMLNCNRFCISMYLQTLKIHFARKHC